MSRTLRRGCLALLLVSLSCGGDVERVFLSIGTGGTGGVYYPLGGAIASRLSLADAARLVTAEVTGGSVENVNRLRSGQLDLAFALGVTVDAAYRGGPDARPSFEELRVIAPLYPNLTHVLVRGGSAIESFADLAGGRVSVGSAGSGTEQVARQLLAAHGLSYDTVDERFLSFSESASALRDGALDAAILSVGYPAGAVLEALSTGGATLLPLDGEGVAKLLLDHTYYALGSIPAGVYPGVAEPVPTIAMMNWIVGRADLPDAVVADLLNILGPERVSLERTHDMARQIDLEALDHPPAPLHAVTEAWRVRPRQGVR